MRIRDFIGAEEARAAVEAVLSLQPDIVVVTGDFVSRLDQGEAELIVQALSRLTAPAGAYAILGNHDHWTEAEVVAAAVRQAGLTLLRNANVTITRGGDTIYLAGVGEHSQGSLSLG